MDRVFRLPCGHAGSPISRSHAFSAALVRSSCPPACRISWPSPDESLLDFTEYRLVARLLMAQALEFLHPFIHVSTLNCLVPMRHSQRVEHHPKGLVTHQGEQSPRESPGIFPSADAA